jgi:CheY-like chemotaxis protein
MMTCSVLVVDDDEAVGLVAQEMLLTLNCDVTSAISGQAALAILEHNNFDLLFLDTDTWVVAKPLAIESLASALDRFRN